MHDNHRLDGNSLFDTALANQAKMDLSIRGHAFFKGRSPVNIPSDEDGVRIARDGKQERPRQHIRQTNAISGIRWSMCARMRNRFPANLETATWFRSSRVAFCFSFRHFEYTSRKSVKANRELPHNSKFA